MAENDDDFDFLLSNFKKSTSILSKTKSDFKKFMDATVITLNKDIEALMTNPENLILIELKTNIEYKTGGNNQTSRVKFLLNHLSKETLKEYSKFVQDSYPKEVNSEELKNIDSRIDANIEKISQWRKINNKIHHPSEMEKEKRELENEKFQFNEFIARLSSIYATFDELIPDEVFGDETLDLENLESVYFLFPDDTEIDEKYLVTFIKELRRIQSPHTSLIRRITIKNNVVELWFDTIKDAEKFYSTKTFVEGIYDKYVRRVSGHKLTLSWGVSYRKDISEQIEDYKNID